MNKFIQRIIVGAAAVSILSPVAVAAWGLLQKPTFTCVEGQFTLLQGDTLSSRVPEYCDGVMADAISWVIETNEIQYLGNLRPGQIIMIKERK